MSVEVFAYITQKQESFQLLAVLLPNYSEFTENPTVWWLHLHFRSTIRPLGAPSAGQLLLMVRTSVHCHGGLTAIKLPFHPHPLIAFRFMTMILIYSTALKLGIIWLEIKCLGNLRKIFISLHLQ